MHKAIISLNDVCVDYKSGDQITHAVKNASFDICEDELLVILGASGCGKTSTLNAIGGMITPSKGSIMWNGVDVAKMTDRQKVLYRRNTVGFIFQRYNLIPSLNVIENVRVASEMVPNALSPEEILDILGLSHKMKSYPAEMSGGEQQRVCIARALAKRPDLLLCDEPTGALDSKNAKLIMVILQEIVKIQHIPIVIITHNPQIAEMANHILFMSNGKIEKETFCSTPVLAENLSLT